MSGYHPFLKYGVKTVDPTVKTDATQALADVKTAIADVSKVEPTVKADVTKAVAVVKTADSKLVTFIQSNAAKIAAAVLILAAVAAWKLI
jgi:hypothetical protein